MKKLTIFLVVGASTLFAVAASAAPLFAAPVASGSNIENVRMICNEDGRCWRERGERRAVSRDSYGYRDSYSYAPRERYIERRGYEERGPGIGLRAPGVSIGIDGGRY